MTSDLDSEIESRSSAKLMAKLKNFILKKLNKNVIFITLLVIVNDY